MHLLWQKFSQGEQSRHPTHICSIESNGMKASLNPLIGNTASSPSPVPTGPVNPPATAETYQAQASHSATIPPTARYPGSNHMRSVLLKSRDQQASAEDDSGKQPANAAVMQNNPLVAVSQGDAHQSDPVAGTQQPVIDTQTLQATHTPQPINCVQFNRTYSNNQPTSLCDEFTDLCSAEQQFCLSIIKTDGTVIGQASLAQLRSRLANREGQVLWTLNDNDDLVLGMKSEASPPLKHSILANGNEALAMHLERPWEDAALDLLSGWLPQQNHILENKSKKVASAGLMKAQRIEGNDFTLIIDNESGHFEPEAESLAHLNRFHALLTSLLSDASFRIKKIALEFYTPGQMA
jgi:hypothetical protein